MILLGNLCFSQHTFELKDASQKYDIKINVEHCEGEECGGKAVID